ncbi:cyclopropane-fatty-acyl-phospholipid synthase [Geomonas sp. Red276]
MDGSKVYGVCPPSLFSTRSRSSGPVTEGDRWLLRTLVRGMGQPAIRATLWDDKDIVTGSGPRLVINNRLTLFRLMINPTLYFGDDYAAGNITVEGGLIPFLEAVNRAASRPGEVRRRSPGRRGRGTINSLAQSRDNIHHHYDLGNEFYRLWLDDEMLYTCAYFPRPGLSLEAAQRAKMELICRKVGLRGGERVIEAGCGWGGLARYLAKCYGARVRAFNISKEQVAYARKQAKKEGIEGVEYIEDDYRNITGECDVFLSIGMLEHVGPANYRSLGAVIDRTLTDRGFGLIHSIGQDVPEPMTGWIGKRIFPGSYPPTIREMMDIFEPCGFSVIDVENLRLHYARTLEHWLERFERHEEKVAALFDENFVRAWRLYLSGSIAGFSTGLLQLFQLLFTRRGNNRVPWTRDHLANCGDDDATV